MTDHPTPRQISTSLDLYRQYASLAMRTGDHRLQHRMARRYWAWTRAARAAAAAIGEDTYTATGARLTVIAALREQTDASNARIPIRRAAVCEHLETVCVDCVTAWLMDWRLMLSVTPGGRELAAHCRVRGIPTSVRTGSDAAA